MYPEWVNIAERLQEIEAETEERELLALAYCCEGDMKSDQMKPKDYADCMVALADKLGFGPTPFNLARASHGYILDFCFCGARGLGKTTVIDGVEYTTCASCCKPLKGTGEKPSVPDNS